MAWVQVSNMYLYPEKTYFCVIKDVNKTNKNWHFIMVRALFYLYTSITWQKVRRKPARINCIMNLTTLRSLKIYIHSYPKAGKCYHSTLFPVYIILIISWSISLNIQVINLETFTSIACNVWQEHSQPQKRKKRKKKSAIQWQFKSRKLLQGDSGK